MIAGSVRSRPGPRQARAVAPGKGGRMARKTVSFLYQLARLANDLETLSSGKPKRIARRAKNKYIGRKLVRKIW